MKSATEAIQCNSGNDSCTCVLVNPQCTCAGVTVVVPSVYLHFKSLCLITRASYIRHDKYMVLSTFLTRRFCKNRCIHKIELDSGLPQSILAHGQLYTGKTKSIQLQLPLY